MKQTIILLLALTACGPGPSRYRSGYVCSCEQRQAVGDYVAQANLQAMGGSDPDDYVRTIYATAVRTLCDHRDSVLADGYGGLATGSGLKSCEMFHPDHTPIQP